MGTLENLGISSGDYTFMSYWDASSLATDGSTYPLFGTDSTGMNFLISKGATTTATLSHGTSSATCSATVTIEETWNHAAVVYSSSSQNSAIYVNGQAASPTCSQFSTAGTTAYYGGGDGSAGSTWTGSLEQARLYTKAIGTEDLLNFSNWCSTYKCSSAYRRNSRRRTVCTSTSCSDTECCETWPACAEADCTVDSKPLDGTDARSTFLYLFHLFSQIFIRSTFSYARLTPRYTSRRRNYCFRDCTESLCCTWRVLTNFDLLPTSVADASKVTVATLLGRTGGLSSIHRWVDV